jgi:hypothetical protein
LKIRSYENQMKIILFVLGLSLTLPLLGQSSRRPELQSLAQYGYRAGTPAIKAASEKAIGIFSDILKDEGTGFQAVSIPGTRSTYEALEILPARTSGEIGRAVNVWKGLLNNLSFLYVPEVLLPNSTSAFMDPKGSFIGIDHGFILDPTEIPSSVLHETYHAFTYKQLQDQEEDLYAGFYSLSSGSFLSATNQEYYFRFGSLDEIVATALSAHLDSIKLEQGVRLSRDQQEELLGRIYFSLNVLDRLSRQLKEVASRLMTNARPSIETTSLRLGDKVKEVGQISFRTESFSREVKPGGGGTYMAPIPDGATVTLYSFSSKISPDALKSRLSKLQIAAGEALDLVQDAKKCIYVVIEYPRLEKSDLECLRLKAPKIYERLEAHKRKAYPLKKFLGTHPNT